MKLYIGTSGWNYAEWKGRFYPPSVKQSDWLRYLAGKFDATEINYSFYRLPRPDVVQRWARQVPGRFRFAIKLWRGITHYKKLDACRDQLARFFDALQMLPTRNRGPILVQLPPGQGCDVAKLDRFLSDFRAVSAPSRWRVAVEFRHDSWLCDDVYRLLDRRGAALCLHDMAGRAAVNQPNQAAFVYVRRHGPSGNYRGGYSRQQLAADARRIRRWLADGKMVFVFFNNDVGGYAVRNAFQLKDLLADHAE